MDIVCTRKIADQIRLTRLAKWTSANSLSCWYGNLFRAPRRAFVAAMESTTLVTVLFPAQGLTNAQSLADALCSTIAAYFAHRGWTALLGRAIAFDDQPLKFWAATDRTMIGSIVEMVRLASWDLEELTDDLTKVMDRTNDAPMSPIGMDAPDWILDRMAGKRGGR